MNKEKEKILNKAHEFLVNYEGDESVYYQELKRAYEEYKKLELSDEVTNELFKKHINDLCDFLNKRKNANATITCLITFIVLIIFLTSFTAIKYYNLSEDLKRSIINHNGSTSLNVEYNNVENFQANKLSDETNFMNLDPLSFSIIATNKDNLDLRVHYDVYLIEENDDIPASDVLTKEAFLYHVNSSSRQSGIKSLGTATKTKNKLLIFSGEVATNTRETIDLRMWIDSNTTLDYINKKYKFKLYVDGYVI